LPAILFEGVEAVLFDLDETLVDSQMGLAKAHERIAQLVSRFLNEHGVQTDFKVLESKIRFLDDRMNKESCYDRDVWWPILADEIESHPIFTNDIIHRLTIEYWKAYSEDSPPYPDTVSTLTYLKQRGYKLGLVTDTDGTLGLKADRIKRLSFREFFFVTVVAGEDTKELKPDPTPFLKASDMLGISSKATVFVGDKPFTDIQGANAAGMRTILIWRRNWDSNVKADLTIKSLADLLMIL
jgi:putative hydrolase of the HAD superfamily